MAGTKGMNGSDAVAEASVQARPGGRRGARDLPDAADVAALLDIRRRPWPSGGDALSFSMRGLWRCFATAAPFDAWFRGKASRGLCVRGVHYVPGKGDDGSDDFFVAVAFGPGRRVLRDCARRRGRPAHRLRLPRPGPGQGR